MEGEEKGEVGSEVEGEEKGEVGSEVEERREGSEIQTNKQKKKRKQPTVNMCTFLFGTRERRRRR